MERLVPEAIEGYALQHSQALPALLEELVRETEARFPRRTSMLTGPVVGALLQLLAASVGARRILEIGTFTGFSALMMAAALPEDGRLVTCDIDPEALELARRFFARSPHGHKIEARPGPALDTVKELSAPFDLVFIDAEKEHYPEYYEASLALLRQGGLIVADNVLWSGRVLDPKTEADRAIVAFNELVARDQRVTKVLLTVRDGLMVARKR